jgi:hypothetical protein
MKSGLRFDYATIGHVTVDVLADGSRRAGGSALYSALQASRLGLRTLVLTQGVPAEVEELLAPYAGELELHVLAAPATTTFETRGSGSERAQRVVGWAGEIPELIEPASAIVHLAPVARETPVRWRGGAEFLGLTPQGLARVWRAPSQHVELARPAAEQEELAGRCDAIVLSVDERDSCARLVERGLREGATVAITAGAGGATLQPAGGPELQIAPHTEVEDATDDLGAGDVFAAALFVALYEGREPARAGAFAAAAAATRLGGSGASAIGTRQAIEAGLPEGEGGGGGGGPS